MGITTLMHILKNLILYLPLSHTGPPGRAGENSTEDFDHQSQPVTLIPTTSTSIKSKLSTPPSSSHYQHYHNNHHLARWSLLAPQEEVHSHLVQDDQYREPQPKKDTKIIYMANYELQTIKIKISN